MREVDMVSSRWQANKIGLINFWYYDEQEERIGYLYLEFKRKSSDTYITIGMGMRARKGKPLDKWYFGLSDGRRIGRKSRETLCLPYTRSTSTRDKESHSRRNNTSKRM